MNGKRRFVCLLLVLALALTVAPAAGARDRGGEESAPVAVTINVYSNLHGLEALPGLVEGKNLYMSPEILAYLTNSVALEPSRKYPVRMRCFSGLMLLELTEDDADTIPMLKADGITYLSVPHFLRFLGFNVSFGEEASDPIHMYVYRQYTVLDAWAEYAAESRARFNISEAFNENSPLLYLSALDTVLLGCDSNLLRYVVDAGGVEEEMYTDALLRILETGGGTGDPVAWDNVVAAFNAETDAASLLSDFPGVHDYIRSALGETVRNVGVLDDVLGVSVFDALSVATGVASDLTGAAETFKAFYNLEDLQKDILRRTLCSVSRDDGLYKELPALFRAAKKAREMTDGVFRENVTKDVFVNLWKTAWNVAGGGPAAAWGLGTSILVDLPGIEGILDREDAVTFATICSDLVIVTAGIGERPTEDVCHLEGRRRNIPSFYDEDKQETARCAMALSLMAGTAARRELLETGWVSERREASMEYAQSVSVKLLDRVIAAQPIAPGTETDIRVDEDLSWMAALCGGYGYVVEYCGGAYYWGYAANSFPDHGTFGTITPSYGGDNRLVRRDLETGETETILESDAFGRIAVAGGRVFFGKDGGVWSVYLDGTDLRRHGDGALRGLSPDGAWVVIAGESIFALNTVSLERNTIVSDYGSVECVWNGVIYYTADEDDWDLAKMGRMTLSRIRPDGTEQWDIYTTQPDLYDANMPVSPATVGQMYFADDYIYFSYGSIGGSGSVFQGGRVVRAAYDGSGGEVVSRTDELCGADFEVGANGTVTCHYDEGFYALFDSMTEYRIIDDTVYWYDRRSGNLEEIVEPADYMARNAEGYYDIEYVSRCGTRVYFLASRIVDDFQAGWRYAYAWQSASFLVKDLDTGEVQVIYNV